MLGSTSELLILNTMLSRVWSMSMIVLDVTFMLWLRFLISVKFSWNRLFDAAILFRARADLAGMKAFVEVEDL